jgi:hypothetical protein
VYESRNNDCQESLIHAFLRVVSQLESPLHVFPLLHFCFIFACVFLVLLVSFLVFCVCIFGKRSSRKERSCTFFSGLLSGFLS